MTRMSMVPVQAGAPRERPLARAAAGSFAVALGGSALLGLLAGYVWGEVAPRALLQEVGTGTAQVVNAETSATSSPTPGSARSPRLPGWSRGWLATGSC
jgi:hypothetical protein